jgi:hypothetical protein
VRNFIITHPILSIVLALIAAEQRIQEITTSYAKNAEGLHMTERREEGEIQ